MASRASATRYERRLEAAAADGLALAADFARAARAARAAVPAADARAAALRDVAAGVAAPMLAAYVLWILGEAAARGTVRIHFLARDGQVLWELARRLAPRLHPGIDCRYLAASRQIWTRAISAAPDHHWLWYGAGPGTTLAELSCCGASRCPAPRSRARSRPRAFPATPGRGRLRRRRPPGSGPGSPARTSPRRRRRRAPPAAGGSSRTWSRSG
jgi:hypothetical protein